MRLLGQTPRRPSGKSANASVPLVWRHHKRMRTKTTLPPCVDRKIAGCEWPGCPAEAQARRPLRTGKFYCKRHAGKISGASVFLRSLDAYSDEAVPTHYAGAMDLPCEACGAWMYRGEQLTQPRPHFRLCCRNGKLSHLWRVPDAPDLLRHLLTNRTAKARHFRDNIREYNAALSFVSFGASYAPPPGRGPPVYRIHGAVYHASGQLFPPADTDPVYAQLYLYDHADALAARSRKHPGLDAEVLGDLQDMLAAAGSPYADDYKRMADVVSEGGHLT